MPSIFKKGHDLLKRMGELGSGRTCPRGKDGHLPPRWGRGAGACVSLGPAECGNHLWLYFWTRGNNVLCVPFLTTREWPILLSPENAPSPSSTPNLAFILPLLYLMPEQSCRLTFQTHPVQLLLTSSPPPLPSSSHLCLVSPCLLPHLVQSPPHSHQADLFSKDCSSYLV